MAMSASSANAPRSEINITPLVDVVLVLLIIFMVAVPVVRAGYLARIPPRAVGPTPPAGQLVLWLGADGSVFINSERVQAGSRATRLAELARGRESQVVFVAAEGTVPYQKVMALVDLCHDSGLGNLGVVLDELPR